MERSTRVLLVDDYAPFRHLVRSTLLKQPELEVIGEALDGLEAVQKALELQPDLILLDVGLPSLNGIEAARRIRRIAPRSKILFLSEDRSWSVVAAALRSGASGYVIKSDAASGLLEGIELVLRGELFVSSSLAGHDLSELRGAHTAGHHEVGFYSDDRRLLEDLTQFAGTALQAGNAVIIIATDAHRNLLVRSLGAFGFDIGAAIEQGRYIALDADETLARFIVNGMPDPVLFNKAFGELIEITTKALKGWRPRIAVFGESVHLLCTQGNAEAAIQMEKLGNQLVDEYDLDILCGYSMSILHGTMDEHIYQRIQAEHSAVHFH
jgi:DNA-binding NarL/FixJ family response regulator